MVNGFYRLAGFGVERLFFQVHLVVDHRDTDLEVSCVDSLLQLCPHMVSFLATSTVTSLSLSLRNPVYCTDLKILDLMIRRAGSTEKPCPVV